MKFECPCGCGKTVDGENVKAGRPFALRSCAKVFRKRCAAGGVDPEMLLKFYRDHTGATERRVMLVSLPRRYEQESHASIETKAGRLPGWFADIIYQVGKVKREHSKNLAAV